MRAAAVASVEGDHTAFEPGCGAASTTRWTARPGTVDHDDDPGNEPGPAEPDPVTASVAGVTAEGFPTDAIGGESDSNGATSIGSAST